MNATEREDLVKELIAQNASDSMDVFEGPTWREMCAIVASDDLDEKIGLMPAGMIDAEAVQHMSGLSSEEKIVTANSAILMTMSDMMRKRAEQLQRLAMATRLAAIKDVLETKVRREARHE